MTLEEAQKVAAVVEATVCSCRDCPPKAARTLNSIFPAFRWTEVKGVFRAEDQP